MSENQGKIKFERTDKDTWSQIVENKTQGTHDNSIVIVVDDNLIYTQGTHIGASKGNAQNNTIFFEDLDKVGAANGLKYLYVGPQYLTGKQQYIVRNNIGAAEDSNNISQRVYRIVETSTGENEITSSVFNDTPVELWENTIMLDFQHWSGSTIQPLFKFAGKYETSVVISNNTNAGVSVLLSGEQVESDETKIVIKSAEEYSSYEFTPYFVNNKSNSDISLNIPQNSSIEVNFLFIGNECRVIVLT